MRMTRPCALTAMILLASGLGIASAEDRGAAMKPGAMPLCPVSGKPVSFEVRSMAGDGPVYFCCKGCVGKFEAEPAKFAAQVAEQRKVLETMPRAQTACPVSGKPVDKAVFTEAGGKRVYFCCKNCVAAYEKEPETFKAKLAASYTYLKPAVCPVSGEPVNFAVKTVSADGPVYFCCKGCVKKFEAEPARYEAKVAEQRKTLAAMPHVQVTCPLSGKPVNKEISLASAGEKVYFCCAGCKDGYAKDPGKYKAKLEGSYTYQTICPVMGEEIDPTSFADLAGGPRIYFCCDACEKKLFKDPAKYAPKLQAQGVKVSADEIKPKS